MTAAGSASVPDGGPEGPARDRSGAGGAGAGPPPEGLSGPGAPPPPPTVSPWRLTGTLAAAGALAGLLLVVVFQLTAPAIAAHREERLRLAVEEVLHEPARFEPLYLVGGDLTDSLPAGTDGADLERVYVGFDEQGRTVGYALQAERPGYQDVVRLLVGYDPAADRLLGMTVLESRETPGLGDRIESDQDFVAQFDGLAPPLEGVKEATGDDPHAVDMLTGATISSRTVIRAINAALERLGAAVRRHAATTEERP